MPIKPIDMQVMLPNIRKAAKAENVKQAAKEMSAQQQQIHEDKQLEHDKNRVKNMEQKDQSAIKNDQKENKHESKSKKRKKKEDEDDEEEKKKTLIPNHGTKFDIKV